MPKTKIKNRFDKVLFELSPRYSPEDDEIQLVRPLLSDEIQVPINHRSSLYSLIDKHLEDELPQAKSNSSPKPIFALSLRRTELINPEPIILEALPSEPAQKDRFQFHGLDGIRQRMFVRPKPIAAQITRKIDNNSGYERWSWGKFFKKNGRVKLIETFASRQHEGTILFRVTLSNVPVEKRSVVLEKMYVNPVYRMSP